MTFMTHSSNFETTLSGKLMIKLINKHFLSETDTNSFEKRTDIYSMYSANKLFIKCEGETWHILSQWRKCSNTHCWIYFLTLMHFDPNTSRYRYCRQNKYDKYSCGRYIAASAVWKSLWKLLCGFSLKNSRYLHKDISLPSCSISSLFLVLLFLSSRTRMDAWDKDNPATFIKLIRSQMFQNNLLGCKHSFTSCYFSLLTSEIEPSLIGQKI